MVDFPLAERPVSQMVKPCWRRREARSLAETSEAWKGYVAAEGGRLVGRLRLMSCLTHVAMEGFSGWDDLLEDERKQRGLGEKSTSLV